MIGSLICEKLGLPFVIRLDGTGMPPAMPPGMLPNLQILCDIHATLDHLGIHAEMVPVLTSVPPTEVLRAVVGDNATRVIETLCIPTITPGTPAAQLVDDIIHSPSLIIRGMEFSKVDYFPDGGVATAGHCLNEDILFAAASLEKKEINLPIVRLGHAKMSKTNMTGVTWSIITSVSSELARSFLIATAIAPEDPIKHLGEEFSLERMSSAPYTWNWEHWNHIVRMSE